MWRFSKTPGDGWWIRCWLNGSSVTLLLIFVHLALTQRVLVGWLVGWFLGFYFLTYFKGENLKVT